MIVYDSRKLKVHERIYQTHHLHLDFVVFALKIWRHYLYGVHADVFTDRKNLQYMFTQKKLNLRQKLELLKHYEMSVLYHPGKANIFADALSCKMDSVSNIYYEKKVLIMEVHMLDRLGCGWKIFLIVVL